jgi:predicted amino acid racemase
MYPSIEINLFKLKKNTEKMVNLCRNYNIELAGVTKVFCAYPQAAAAMVEGGIRLLADSRIENLKKLQELPAGKLLLRLPMPSQAEDVVRYSDISLNSELSTLRLLGEAAFAQQKTHQVILMVDMGDLREGIWPDQVSSFVMEALQIKGIAIKGFGTNLTCYGGVIPDASNLGTLVDIAREMEEKYKLDLEYISGGNSSSIYLLSKGRMPEGINNLRLGESIVLGRETAFGEQLEGFYDDIFVVKGEIVELKEKPTVPIGEIGMDAFGNKPEFKDRGIIRRAIVAMGRQDIDPDGFRPIDESISILGGSSDHTIIDVTGSKRIYQVGDVVSFKVDYGCLLRAMTSPYVEKVIQVGDD